MASNEEQQAVQDTLDPSEAGASLAATGTRKRTTPPDSIAQEPAAPTIRKSARKIPFHHHAGSEYNLFATKQKAKFDAQQALRENLDNASQSSEDATIATPATLTRQPAEVVKETKVSFHLQANQSPSLTQKML